MEGKIVATLMTDFMPHKFHILLDKGNRILYCDGIKIMKWRSDESISLKDHHLEQFYVQLREKIAEHLAPTQEEV